MGGRLPAPAGWLCLQAPAARALPAGCCSRTAELRAADCAATLHHAALRPPLSRPQAIPGLSPVPWWGTLFPLAVVLMVNGVKEAFDDYWRHVSDAEVNRR